MSSVLDLQEVEHRLTRACSAVIEAKDRLTKADQATGDGDHGVGMARGFAAALNALQSGQPAQTGDLFKSIGMAIMSTSGGASGAVFGTFFVSAAAELNGTTGLTASGFVAALQSGLEAVQKRGGAKPGDKTVIDALVPAIEAAGAAQADAMQQVLEAAAGGARDGVQASIDMQAATGKARSLGERSIGHPDPGAITLAVFLAALAGLDTA